MMIWFLIVLLAIVHVCSINKSCRWLFYVSKLAPIVLVIVSLLLADKASVDYVQLVILGLCCSVIGDVCLMLPKERFRLGLAFFGLAHALYFTAFWGQITPVFSPLLIAILILSGLGFYSLICNNLKRDKLPVAIYIALILIVTWAAVEYRVLGYRQSSAFALTGTVLFVLSGMVFAIDRFRTPSLYSRQVVMITYFTAQIFIGLSAYTYV
ncbi:lysoplasmalogenase [Vibrio amylolyticus]|uniref:lysoplasmalogenase n=1 Tax=Vibrio amylolyticus TaxID=2847292 RepID=UPI00354E0E8B